MKSLRTGVAAMHWKYAFENVVSTSPVASQKKKRGGGDNLISLIKKYIPMMF